MTQFLNRRFAKGDNCFELFERVAEAGRENPERFFHHRPRGKKSE
jgi:hypothetical protein